MKLNVVLETLKSFKPLSIFVYGSQANEDVNTKSDYEIGVIFEDKKYIPRAKIKESISDNSCRFRAKCEEGWVSGWNQQFAKQSYG